MTSPVIAAQGLGLARPGGAKVLSGIDLALAPGERVGLVGPNGAGKSTLLLTLAGALTPTTGRVVLKGQTLRPGDFAPGVGLVFQDADDQLFSPTVAEDVAFGALNLGLTGGALSSAVATALDRTGMVHLADRPVHHLSGGEKRLACIAGMLVMNPEVLLLDEPSAALDLRNRRRLIALLAGLPQAMLIASHDLELILDLCPRVVLIDATPQGGCIMADGPARAILGDAVLMASHGQEVPHSLVPHGDSAHRHR
jgi:cobalt/nickel transport system ATP-binding protein